jgi:hypothetical protein
MRSRTVRRTLTLLAVVAIGAAAYFYWTGEVLTRAILERADAFEERRSTAVRQTFELRSAQQAYVAAGQSEAFWFEKAATEISALRATLASLKAATTAAAAHAALDEAAGALEEFEEGDRRVRNYASSGQKLLASDVIFSDGLAAAARIGSALDQAREAAVRADAAVTEGLFRDRLMAAGAAAILGLLVLFLLTPVPVAPVETSLEQAVPAGDPGGLDLRPAFKAERAAESTPPPGPVPAAPMPTVAATPQPAGIEIQSLADVCTDLARLTDTSAMPAILERTAETLDAAGLVLWVIAADGKELVAIAAHGYPASVVSRMGSLPIDAENATAAAFRTASLQTVTADGLANGAIAAPLVSPAGCLGVLSAEVRHDGHRQPARLAAASIVAAQLATLVAPPAARSEDRTTATL